MEPLPLDRLDEFCSRLERTWWANRSASKRRDAACIGVMLCGLRWVEAHRLRLKDVSVSDGMLHVRTAKGGIDRRLPIGESFATALLQQQAEIRRRKLRSWSAAQHLQASQWLFITHNAGRLSYEAIRRRLRDWTKDVWDRPYSPHCLRHTAALRCYLETRDVMEVHRLLGHRSLQWTRAYLATIEGCGGFGLPDFCRGVNGPAGWTRPHAPRLFDPEDLRMKRLPDQEGGAA